MVLPVLSYCRLRSTSTSPSPSLYPFSSPVFSFISKHTSELGVGDTGPFPTTVPHTRAPHHVSHVMLFIPLISHAIHDPFVGCTDFFMGCLETDEKCTVKNGHKVLKDRQHYLSSVTTLRALTWTEVLCASKKYQCCSLDGSSFEDQTGAQSTGEARNGE